MINQYSTDDFVLISILAASIWTLFNAWPALRAYLINLGFLSDDRDDSYLPLHEDNLSKEHDATVTTCAEVEKTVGNDATEITGQSASTTTPVEGDLLKFDE
jgi:hypothetical protein